MRIRTLVPALACLAAAPIVSAADPAVKFDGFVDTYYTISNAVAENTASSTGTGFGYAGKLGVAATISEKVGAQVDLNVTDNGTQTLASRQVYGTWKVCDGVVLKTGKFISDYGWTAAYAPGLYRVNAGPIAGLYGVDQVGANATYTKGDLKARLTIANGFFGEGNAATAQAAGQSNQAYAYGLDVEQALGDLGSVNAEVVYDQDAGGVEESAGYHLGLNATLTPPSVKELTVGVELIQQFVQRPGKGNDAGNMGVTVLANYKLATQVPMSVTGQITAFDVENAVAGSLAGATLAANDSLTGTEYAVALLSNPAGTDKLGANLEVNYTTYELNSGAEVQSLGVAAELLYVF